MSRDRFLSREQFLWTGKRENGYLGKSQTESVTGTGSPTASEIRFVIEYRERKRTNFRDRECYAVLFTYIKKENLGFDQIYIFYIFLINRCTMNHQNRTIFIFCDENIEARILLSVFFFCSQRASNNVEIIITTKFVVVGFRVKILLIIMKWNILFYRK